MKQEPHVRLRTNGPTWVGAQLVAVDEDGRETPIYARKVTIKVEQGEMNVAVIETDLVEADVAGVVDEEDQ